MSDVFDEPGEILGDIIDDGPWQPSSTDVDED